MTFVNMYSPGLRILATHRLVGNLANFDPAALLDRLRAMGSLASHSAAEARQLLGRTSPDKVRMGIAFPGGDRVHLFETRRDPGALDVRFLHERILDGALGIGDEAVREEKYLRYIRGVDAALAGINRVEAQAAFLLQPTTVQQVADTSFGGGVMPQKSTDFYPKLLTGLTIYKLDQ